MSLSPGFAFALTCVGCLLCAYALVAPAGLVWSVVGLVVVVASLVFSRGPQ